tara:strand:- start:5638 stop:6318 length:681 start_codon:yes stop_codon:yes gene_type:complete
MAENKKSFVLYSDLINSIGHLTNEEKGILFNHLLEYVNDMNPILADRLVLTAWKPIELQLKRDLIKFEEVKSKRSDAGKRSAELKSLKLNQQNSTNSTSVKSVKQNSTNSTVNDNDNVNVIAKAIKVIPTIDEFLAFALAFKPNVNQEDVKLKYQSWVVNDWSVTRQGKTNPIKNWKSTLLNTIPFFGVVAPEYKSPHQKEYEHIMKAVNEENERQRLLNLENDTN